SRTFCRLPKARRCHHAQREMARGEREREVVLSRSPVPCWQVVGLERRAVAEARGGGGTGGRPGQDGPLGPGGGWVEPGEGVARVDGAAEDRERAGGVAPRSVGEGRLPGTRDLGHALLQLA